MKIIVGVKRVVDYNVKVRLKEKAGQWALDLDHLKMSMNPFDETALEEALRLKEQGAASEIIAVSVGAAAAQDILRHALALGADRAVLAETDEELEPINIARVLAALIRAEGAELALLGKQAIDDDSSQTGQMLAAILGWPQISFVSSVQAAGSAEGEWQAERETDTGAQRLAFHLPAVITADLRLNEPRYASLPNIMKARKKPIEHKSVRELAPDLPRQTELLGVAPPPARQAGVKLADAAELAEKLRAAKLL